MEETVDSAVQVEKVSLWRATREIFRDSRSTWKNVLNECPASWRTIRSGMSWCCLLLIINGAFWLFGGLLFASLEGMFMFIIYKPYVFKNHNKNIYKDLISAYNH